MVQDYSSEDFHSSAMRASASAGSLASLPRSGVSQASHTRSRLSRSGLADLNKASGTRSYCGSQVLSHKSSAPSFSFGSGPSRLTFTGAAARGDQTLQASVSSGGAVSPGPIYNPSPSSKWLGDAPKPGFGTQEQRPSAATASGDVSRLTGKSNLPGPGSYQQPSSVGKQALGRCHSYSMYSFGNQRQRENAAKATPSPGPVYDPKGTSRSFCSASVQLWQRCEGEERRFIAADSWPWNLHAKVGLRPTGTPTSQERTITTQFMPMPFT